MWYHKLLKNQNIKFAKNISYYHDDANFRQRFGNKSILYSFFNDQDIVSVAEKIGIYNNKYLNMACGIVCESLSEIYDGYQQLQTRNQSKEFVLKYASGTAALDQYYVSSVNDIKNKFKWLSKYDRIIIEPNFNYNCNKCIFLGCQFYDGKVTE
eukprot:470409_1